MVAPVVAPVVAPAATGIVAAIAGSTIVRYTVGTTLVYLSGKQVWYQVDKGAQDEIEEFEKSVLEAGGLGGAIIDGLDNAYDDVRNKLRGREPDVIAGIVVAALSIGTVVFLYHSVKARALKSA